MAPDLSIPCKWNPAYSCTFRLDLEPHKKQNSPSPVSMLALGIGVPKNRKKWLMQQLFPSPQEAVTYARQYQRCGFIPAWGIAPGIGPIQRIPASRHPRLRDRASISWHHAHDPPRNEAGFHPGALPQAGMASGLWPSRTVKHRKTQMCHSHNISMPDVQRCSSFDSCPRLSHMRYSPFLP